MKLYRAGSVLQAMFYTYLEKMFDMVVDEIEKKDGKIYIHEGRYPMVMKSIHDLIQPFPSQPFNNHKERQGVSSHLSCSDAVDWLHKAASYFLKPLASSIKDMTVRTKNPKLEIITIEFLGKSDNEVYSHEIWTITLKQRGESYVIRLSDPQHGYYDPVIPKSEYWKLRVIGEERSSGCQYFGANRDRLLSTENLTDFRKDFFTMYKVLSKSFEYATKKWEKENKLTVQEMLELPQGEFNRQKEKLLELAGARTQKYIDHLLEKKLTVGNW